MSLSTSRSPSLAARARQRPSDLHHDGRPKHNFSRTLVIHRGIHIQGVVQDVEKLVVEGTMETDHLTAKELVIAHGGRFQGTADIEVAEISGILDGELTAKASLQVCATGRLNGNAACRRLQVEDGGEISGKIEMLSTIPQTKISKEDETDNEHESQE
ncbi:bactofilin family protein [Saccharibacter floricola]|nr:polymer-forming cytoskeletal protein [Saccharibacter floricola]